MANLGEKYGGRSFRNRSIQTTTTTLDGKSPIETFCTNPNILKVSDTSRGVVRTNFRSRCKINN